MPSEINASDGIFTQITVLNHSAAKERDHIRTTSQNSKPRFYLYRNKC